MENITEKIAGLINEVRLKKPLVHNITNYVTVNDCANILLAVGASPIMADDIGEAEEITAISSALVLNIGTLNQRTVESMLASGKRANELGIPVVFDPVGVGASTLRNKTTETILTSVGIAVLRGNMSEISFIAGLGASAKGVDASDADMDRQVGASIAEEVANRLGCVVAITGALDIISDGKRTVTLANGHKMLSQVTGTGCMTTALVGAYCGAAEDKFFAAVAGIASMGICGEIAFEMAGYKGTGSFRTELMDAVSRLDQKVLLERIKLYET